ncbi:DUF397 domain-containing protein [Streptomyces sp. NPDC014748]|uniref:DUF397 domain-containing protein n=1 Tax=Streptomyces sp. NPDC014748 TaxID=3364905 RepID=UPI0037036D19
MTSKTLFWQTSSYSTGNGACIEVAKTTGGAYFRDTKDRPRGAAAVAPGPWGAFLTAVKTGVLA